MKPTLSMAVVGAGRMGWALALSLCRLEQYRLRFVASRTRMHAEHLCHRVGQGAAVDVGALLEPGGLDLVWLAVPDRELADVAEFLAKHGHPDNKPQFVHVSGCFSSEALRPLKLAGHKVGGVHPLQAVAQRGQFLRPGTFYAIEAESDDFDRLRRIVHDLKGKPLKLPASKKALYHAAAAVASNYMVVLAEMASTMLTACGLEPHTANEALSGLVRGTLDNVSQMGPVEALTGPIQRGDIEVVLSHILALRSLGDKSLISLYSALGLRACELARLQGSVDAERLSSVEALLRRG